MSNENYTSAEEEVKLINSGDRVYIHSVAAAPHYLLEAMTNRADELRDVELIQLHTEGPALYSDPKYKDSFHVNAL